MSSSPAFDAFFTTATKTVACPAGYPPYDYQRLLAGGDEGRPCKSQLIVTSAGLGKNAIF